MEEGNEGRRLVLDDSEEGVGGGGGRVHDIFHRNDFTRCIFLREGQEGMGY